MRPLGFGETANGYEKAVSWLAFPDWGQGLTATFFVRCVVQRDLKIEIPSASKEKICTCAYYVRVCLTIAEFFSTKFY
jgi:predicted thioesterase